MDFNQEVNRWIKIHYREAPVSGPEASRIKFSDVLAEVQQAFPTMNVSSFVVSDAISKEFPMSFGKKVGEKKHKYIYGIKINREEESGRTPHSLQVMALEQSLQQERRMNECLRQQLQQVQQRFEELKLEQRTSTAIQKLDDQMQTLLQPNMCTFHGPNTVDHFHSFSLDTVIAELHTTAPDVVELFKQLSKGDRFENDKELLRLVQRSTTALCTLLKGRSVNVLGIQLLFSFMLIGQSASKQVITVLNHAGLCTSYTTAWKYLKQLTQESRYLEIIRDGYWLWIYDNLNLHQKVRHERQDHHSSMLNLTARLAVKIKNLPDFEFDWADNTPQRPRASLKVEDFLPSEADAAALNQRAVRYMMGFLVETFSNLNNLSELVPEQESIHPVTKSEVVPMKILFKDEKFKSQTIDILTRLISDANLSGNHQLVVGDQLTCKNIRGCKLWRASEVDVINRLTWAHEDPGDFHFLWECLRVIFLTFWGTPAEQGSLCSIRERIRRTQVDKGVKIFSIGDEFLVHVFKGHLAARICTILGLKSTSEAIPHEKSLTWLQSMAEKLVVHTLMPVHTPSCDTIYGKHRAFLHQAFLYMDLRCAIRFENGPHIVRLWKLWLPMLIGTGRKNYAVECVHLIANLCAELPKHLSYIMTHNRTVNMEGKVGRGKPLDQMIEHYNLALKEAMRTGGSNLTQQHAEDLSLCALFLMDASKRVASEFGARRSKAHTTSDANKDIATVLNSLLEKQVTQELQERTSVAFKDPTDIGLDKLCNTNWIQDTLSRTECDDNLEEDTIHEITEYEQDYGLSDII